MNVPHRLRTKIALLAVILILAGGGCFWLSAHKSADAVNTSLQGVHQKGRGKGHNMPPAPVQVARAEKRDVPYYLTSPGTVNATSTVAVRSRIDGQLMALHFNEGQQVTAGQALAEIDPRPWQVALLQAQGQQAKNQATLNNALSNLTRYEQLVKTNLISRQQLETQRATVKELLGTLKADEANVASAQLNLSYSQITAPIGGRIGLKRVDIGNYITSGDVDGIAVITQTHPIDVIFNLPEKDIPLIQQALKTPPALTEIWDRSNSRLLATGNLYSLDNQIDVATGTLKMKARFDNMDDALFPNQFVNVRLKVATLQNAIVIPVAALQMSNEGYFVWQVADNNQVIRKTVLPGLQADGNVAITEGLAADSQVVTDGLDRLTEGALVEVVAPSTDSSHPVRGDRG